MPNVVAMMTGSSVNELKNGCARNKTWDECRFVWSDYHDAGFATMYVEDNPFISTFNYLQKGFVNKPTDHYPRYTSLFTKEVALDDTAIKWLNFINLSLSNSSFCNIKTNY